MIVTDKAGNQTKIVINAEFKKRVKLFIKNVYGLAMSPSNKKLKEMFPKYSDLRSAMNWLHIYKISEEKLEEMEKQAKVKVLTVIEALELADITFKLKGIYNVSKSSTTRTYAFRGIPVGSVLYERYAKKYQVRLNGLGNIKEYFADINDVIEFFINNTEIVWSTYSTVA